MKLKERIKMSESRKAHGHSYPIKEDRVLFRDGLSVIRYTGKDGAMFAWEDHLYKTGNGSISEALVRTTREEFFIFGDPISDATHVADLRAVLSTGRPSTVSVLGKPQDILRPAFFGEPWRMPASRYTEDPVHSILLQTKVAGNRNTSEGVIDSPNPFLAAEETMRRANVGSYLAGLVRPGDGLRTPISQEWQLPADDY